MLGLDVSGTESHLNISFIRQILMSPREINAAIPVTVFLLISVTLYGFYDNLSGEDEGSGLNLVDPVWDYEHDSENGYGSVTGGYVYRGQNAPSL